MYLFSDSQRFSFALMFSACFVFFFFMLLQGFAFGATPSGGAQAGDAIAKVICNAIGAVQGPIGKAIAVVVLLSVALGMFFGKVTWALAIMTAVAMSLMFGAEQVVSLLTGDSSFSCANLTGS